MDVGLPDFKRAVAQIRPVSRGRRSIAAILR